MIMLSYDGIEWMWSNGWFKLVIDGCVMVYIFLKDF